MSEGNNLYVIEGDYILNELVDRFFVSKPTVNIYTAIAEKDTHFVIMLFGKKTKLYKNKHVDRLFTSEEAVKDRLREMKQALIDKIKAGLAEFEENKTVHSRVKEPDEQKPISL